ncbi:Hypothetical_protein [Hexamita inflata]|uniref:Hypothetical_protein n=1 Tax=Hexamita inflata TaxID=28002 RepID=A0AA86QME6_9EUKA|nr:Hypothetical protein HINF_LOCUS46091 [Hexamita inflata]
MVEVVFENFVNYLRSGNTDKLNIISFQQNQQHKINLSTQLIFYRILTKTVVQLNIIIQVKQQIVCVSLQPGLSHFLIKVIVKIYNHHTCIVSYILNWYYINFRRRNSFFKVVSNKLSYFCEGLMGFVQNNDNSLQWRASKCFFEQGRRMKFII